MPTYREQCCPSGRYLDFHSEGILFELRPTYQWNDVYMKFFVRITHTVKENIVMKPAV